MDTTVFRSRLYTGPARMRRKQRARRPLLLPRPTVIVDARSSGLGCRSRAWLEYNPSKSVLARTLLPLKHLLQAPLRIWQEGSNFTPAFLCAAQPDLVAGRG